jgi:deoxycytidylate deaminase
VRFVYCTDSPCRECAKAIRALPGVQEVHYGRFYTAEGIDILINGGIRVIGHEELFGTPLNLILQQYERGTR